jgi:hypothetical protein
MLTINSSSMAILITVAGLNVSFCQPIREMQNEQVRLAVMNRSTEPSYLVLTAIDKKSNAKKEIVTTSNQLIGAIMREFSVKTEDRAIEIILNNKEMEFQFSKEEALTNIDFGLYTDVELTNYKSTLNIDSVRSVTLSNPAINKKLRPTNPNWLFDYSNEAGTFADKKTQLMFAHVLFKDGIRTYKSEVGFIVLYHTID